LSQAGKTLVMGQLYKIDRAKVRLDELIHRVFYLLKHCLCVLE
jgi:hypothetical protein